MLSFFSEILRLREATRAKCAFEMPKESESNSNSYDEMLCTIIGKISNFA